ncbi:MAG: gamma-glutamylcyclotransferase [bacterium]
MARKASAKLFIYGSLRVDSNNPFKRYLRNHSTFAATGSFTGKLYDLGEFPAAIPSANPQDQVSGEVRLLKDPQAILQKLDRYEGCDLPQPLFIRRLAEIAVENQNVLTAWIYLYNRSIKGCPQIVSGDYLQHLEESQLCSTTSDLQS